MLFTDVNLLVFVTSDSDIFALSLFYFILNHTMLALASGHAKILLHRSFVLMRRLNMLASAKMSLKGDLCTLCLPSHADVLKLVTRSSPRRSWGGTRDEPKNVCVGG